jgi:hypothetical protein
MYCTRYSYKGGKRATTVNIRRIRAENPIPEKSSVDTIHNIMDELGLPVAFGKPTAPVKEAAAPARGGSSSRGERGVVGGGKKSKRGRGGASVDDRPDATSWDRSGGLTSQYDAFNGGVKVSICIDATDGSDHTNLNTLDPDPTHRPCPQTLPATGGEAEGVEGEHQGVVEVDSEDGIVLANRIRSTDDS